jgi:hypothetical protein
MTQISVDRDQFFRDLHSNSSCIGAACPTLVYLSGAGAVFFAKRSSIPATAQDDSWTAVA